MQRGGRGDGDLFGFGDPFAGFGRTGSLFAGALGGRDPFDDPFFTQPFGSMFGPGTFPGPSMFDTMRSPFFFEGTPHGAGFLEDRPPPQPKKSRGPIIRELDPNEEEENGDVNGGGGRRTSGREPYVQDPDDEEVKEDKVGNAQYGNNYSGAGPSNERPQGRAYTFRSSTVTFGGTDGAYYTSSTTRRTGGDGVTVEESKEADTTTGQATHRISRGLHGKGHSLTRKLSSDGRVDTTQTLHNLNEDDLAGFEEAWKGDARRHLPGWNHDYSMFNSGRSGGAASGLSLPFRGQRWQEAGRAGRQTNPNTNGPSRRRIFIE